MIDFNDPTQFREAFTDLDTTDDPREIREAFERDQEAEDEGLIRAEVTDANDD